MTSLGDVRRWKITVHPHPDGLYLIKGGDRKVWERFKIRSEWRKSQGIVHGKRCGTIENIGPPERARWCHSIGDRRGA